MGLGRRSAFALAWTVAWTLNAASRAVTYLAAGVLTRDELTDAIGRNWETFGRDEPYILSGLLPWEARCYDRVLRPGDTILLVGSGTGRDLIALVRRGHEVEGLEPSEGALAVSREMLDRLGLRARLRHGAIETAALDGRFDVIVFSYYSYGYIPESRARIAALAKAKAHLNPGGRVILPYMLVERRRALPARLARLATVATRSDWRPEAGDTLTVSLADRRYVHFAHDFEADEIEGEARSAGLRVLSHDRSGDRVVVLGA